MIAAGRVALEASAAGRVTLVTLMRAALLTKAVRTSIMVRAVHKEQGVNVSV